MDTENPTLAFYYPGWIWRDPRWLKNLLLFFDGVALLVPDYMAEAPEMTDPALVAGLREHGLLTVLEPETMVDEATARTLAEAIGGLLEAGLADDLGGGPLGSISHARLGLGAAPGLIEPVIAELRERGLAGHSEDGVSLPINRDLRVIILTLLAQLLRSRGVEQGLDLAPATDQRRLQLAFTELFEMPSLSTAGNLFALDTQAVGVDLSAVGLDEVLEFRAQHGPEFRAYAEGLRGAVAELAAIADHEDREARLAERRQGFEEAGRALAALSRSHWKRPASFLLGIGGAGWAAHSGNPLDLLISAAGVGVELAPGAKPSPNAYSYICEAALL